MLKKYELSNRGFIGYTFEDLYGSDCSIQQSSLASEDAIWFGVDEDFKGRKCTRMHLNKEHVEALLPILKSFLEDRKFGHSEEK